MKVFSPGRISRMCVCFVSAIAGIIYATVYAHTESPQFKELFFASFILRTIHAFLTGTFTAGVIFYQRYENEQDVGMIRERRPIICWFAILASLHLILPLIREPSLLLTAGTGLFLFSTFVNIYLAGGLDAAMGVDPKVPTV